MCYKRIFVGMKGFDGKKTEIFELMCRFWVFWWELEDVYDKNVHKKGSTETIFE